MQKSFITKLCFKSFETQPVRITAQEAKHGPYSSCKRGNPVPDTPNSDFRIFPKMATRSNAILFIKNLARFFIDILAKVKTYLLVGNTTTQNLQKSQKQF